MFKAIQEGQLNKLETIFEKEKNKDLVNQRDLEHPLRYTPLHYAADLNNIEILTFLLSQEGVQLNKRDKEGRSCFLIACIKRNEDVLRILLKDPRVDVNLYDKQVNAPITFLFMCLEKSKGEEEEEEKEKQKQKDLKSPLSSKEKDGTMTKIMADNAHRGLKEEDPRAR